MTAASRLLKATAALSPLQRAVLMLQARREGRELDPAVSRIDDPQERRVFNRYAALAYAINHVLGSACFVIQERLDAVDTCATYYEVFCEVARHSENHEGLKAPARPRKDWRQARAIMPSRLFRSLAAESRDEAIEGVAARWRELRALEVVWQELAVEFGGEDPVTPELRREAESIRTSLAAIADRLGMKPEGCEPSEELLQGYRDQVDRCFRDLGLVEPYA